MTAHPVLGAFPPLSESVSPYSQNTIAYQDALKNLGYAGQSLTAKLNDVVTTQGYMMATNDFFRISCAMFVVLAVLVWVTKPKKGAGPAMGH